LDTKTQHLCIITLIIEDENLSNFEDLDSFSKSDLQVNNTINMNKNIDNEDDLSLSELDEFNFEEQVQE
ncbi:14021_t:CDS:1, partial [Racocetra fulgida]